MAKSSRSCEKKQGFPQGSAQSSSVIGQSCMIPPLSTYLVLRRTIEHSDAHPSMQERWGGCDIVPAIIQRGSRVCFDREVISGQEIGSCRLR